MNERIYIDTSVVGGQFDKEFSADTIPFFEAVVRGQVIIVVSEPFGSRAFAGTAPGPGLSSRHSGPTN